MVGWVEGFGGVLAVSGSLRLRSGQALRLRDCEERNRSAQDDRLVGEWAGSRFLAALGMTERKARAKARAEAGSSLPPQQAKNACRGPRLRSE